MYYQYYFQLFLSNYLHSLNHYSNNDLESITSRFVVIKTELGKDINLPANSTYSIIFPVLKSGYTALAIKSWALYNRDNAQNLNVNGVTITNKGGCIELKNSSSATTLIPKNAYFEVLYLKN